MISKEPAVQEASAMTNQGMHHLPTKLNTENQKAVRARRLHLVPRTNLIITLAVKAIRRTLHTVNLNTVTVTRNPRAVNRSHILIRLMVNRSTATVIINTRAVNQNHIPTGNQVMEKVTMLTRVVMASPMVINDRHPMEDTTRVLSNT